MLLATTVSMVAPCSICWYRMRKTQPELNNTSSLSRLKYLSWEICNFQTELWNFGLQPANTPINFPNFPATSQRFWKSKFLGTYGKLGRSVLGIYKKLYIFFYIQYIQHPNFPATMPPRVQTSQIAFRNFGSKYLFRGDLGKLGSARKKPTASTT